MNSFLQHRKPTNGLTLIEVMISIAVVALLIAIAIPMFSQMRTRTSLAVCGAQLREVNMALLAYASGAGGQFPWSATLPHDVGRYFWARALVADGYLTDKRSLFCPEQLNWWHSMMHVSATAQSSWPWAGVGYGASRYGLMPLEDNAPGRKRANMGSIQVPWSSVITLREADNKSHLTTYTPPRDGSYWFTPGGYVPTWHGQQFNAAFLDGHIEVVTHEQEAIWTAVGSGQPPYYKESFIR